MSTNYYWHATLPTGASIPPDDDPLIHIGLHTKNCTKFVWAQEPETVKSVCEKNLDKEIIQDEYHGKHTGARFLEIIAGVTIHRTADIGKEFC